MIGSGFYDYKARTGLYSTAIVFYRNKVDETWVFEAFFDQRIIYFFDNELDTDDVHLINNFCRGTLTSEKLRLQLISIYLKEYSNASYEGATISSLELCIRFGNVCFM